MHQEQHNDRLRRAMERRRHGSRRRAGLTDRVLAWLGSRLQAWGRRLESEHGAGRSLSRDGLAG